LSCKSSNAHYQDQDKQQIETSWSSKTNNSDFYEGNADKVMPKEKDKNKENENSIYNYLALGNLTLG
jgi:hypothetical protein